MIDILQKRPQACLSLLKGLILVHIHFITLQHILQNFSSNAFSSQLCAFILTNKQQKQAGEEKIEVLTTSGSEAEVGKEKLRHSCRRTAASTSRIVFASLRYHAACATGMPPSGCKACPMCGHTSDANRPNKGLLFVCQNCHYVLHADLVGVRNMTMRTLLARQDWARTGILSECPDVSSDETKAERLQRYSELWWSLDTSLSHSMGRGL